MTIIMPVEAARLIPAMELAIALADEGVPVRAIARSVRISADDIYDILKAAIAQGRLLELPKPDWPPGTKKSARYQAENTVLSYDDDTLSMACSAVFNLSRSQAYVFIAILRRTPDITKEQLHNAIEANRPANDDPTDRKIVDVVMHNIRRKIERVDANLQIKTVWGKGYTMEHDARTLALTIISNHLEQPRIEGIAA